MLVVSDTGVSYVRIGTSQCYSEGISVESKPCSILLLQCSLSSAARMCLVIWAEESDTQMLQLEITIQVLR